MTSLLDTPIELLPRSRVQQGDLELGMAKTDAGLRLVILGAHLPAEFTGVDSEIGGKTLRVAELSASNAAALRARLDWLQPRLLGLKTSAGMGDRLGLATPGHVRATRAFGNAIAPIFAQQSIREMARTRRTPQQVMDDATWGIFQEGWRGGVGADADHLKTPADIDACLAAGFTFYTIDPGEHVVTRAEPANDAALAENLSRLSAEMNPAESGLEGKRFDLEDLTVTFDRQTLLRAADKYGAAIAHIAVMYRHLCQAAQGRAFELEVSVDETAEPTSHAEHIYIASELKRLGITWVSLAPRYPGRFEKGVDYIGDLEHFTRVFAGHAAIARAFGPYKLSLHSGSDKYSIYPIAAELSRGLVHLKTAGTSYLEALRTVAALDVQLMGEIYNFALERYETDRASYHVSAEIGRAPRPSAVQDWPALLDQFDAREILHVTFGSVLTDTDIFGELRFYNRIMGLLREHPEEYAANLERHFIRHLRCFAEPEVQ